MDVHSTVDAFDLIPVRRTFSIQRKTYSISFGSKLLNQCSKPQGWLGRFNLWRMNRSHSKVTEWGLKHVSPQKSHTILDVGCGGGKTIARLAAMATEGKTYGIDYSEESVAASRRENRKLIAAGRVEVMLGSVSHLPFPDQMFDLVTAVETHYYWPDLNADMREVLRVLKPDGTLIIIAEAYKGGKYDQILQKLEELRGMMNYAHLTAGEHREMFEKAGYSDVQVFEEYEKGWICATGGKRTKPF
jgi:ubiquinone/menaquinone biosynthesis C-methylase UbiE